MKKLNPNLKTNTFKKIFIKICRILGYEIIDQNNFSVPTQNKKLSDSLSIPGAKSITIPMGEIKITRKVSQFVVLFRSCTSVNMLTQNKERLFSQDKIEYTLRSLNSILKSLDFAKNNFPKINFKIFVIDFNSSTENIELIKKKLNSSSIENKLINLDINEFKNKIDKINSQGKEVSKNQISNMSNIHKSLLIAKNECDDLIYFIEDDYIHAHDSISEMIFSYEKISSLLKNDIIMCPADYPYLYNKIEPTQIFLGEKKHWRRIKETLVSFLISKNMVINYWDKFTSMCKHEHYPFESPLHEIYKNEYCLSPIPALAMHCTNVNSVYGISPNFDWEKAWKENEI